MSSWYVALMRLRNTMPALRTGSMVMLYADARVLAFARVAPPAKPVIVVLNKSGQVANATIPLRGLYPNGTTLEDTLVGTPFAVSGGSVRVQVQPRFGIVLIGR